MGVALKKTIVAALLAALTALMFWPATGYDFVFDDWMYKLDDNRMAGGLSLEGLAWVFTSTEVSLYQPVAALTQMLDFHLYGEDPFGHHLTSLLLHAASSILIFLVLASLTGALWKSAAVAALCAAHPLRVEPAAWVSGRADLLAALFGMLALWAWTRFLRMRARRWAALAAGALLLGMSSKAVVVTLPFALLVLDFWPLGRLSLAGRCCRTAGRQERGGAVVAALIAEKAWLILVAATLVAVSLSVLEHGPLVVPKERYPLAARAATALVSYAFYIGKTLWPTGLTVFYPHRWGAFAPWELGGAATLLLATSVVAATAARRCPYLAAGWLWFLGTLLPVIGLYQARHYPVADRYAYLPQIGLFVMAVWGFEELGRGQSRRRAAAAVAVGALILACVPASRAQLRRWKDDTTLFSHALAVTRDNWLAHLNFGKALLDRGELAAGYAQVREAVRLRPDLAQTRNILGLALSALGRHEDAVASFRVALHIDPLNAETRYNLGTSLATLRCHGEAVASLREAIRLKPGYAKAHANLGFSLAALGRFEEAAASLRAAVRHQHAFPEAWYYLGLVQVEQGRPAEAARSFREALRIRPEYPEAREGLNRIL